MYPLRQEARGILDTWSLAVHFFQGQTTVSFVPQTGHFQGSFAGSSPRVILFHISMTVEKIIIVFIITQSIREGIVIAHVAVASRHRSVIPPFISAGIGSTKAVPSTTA